MHYFNYRNGVLHAEGVDLVSLADKVGTPFYCYSTATLERHYEVFAGAFADVPSMVCYAMKANSNQAGHRDAGAVGAGADEWSPRRTQARAQGRHPAGKNHVFRRRQDGGRTRGRGRRRHFLHQRRIRTGA